MFKAKKEEKEKITQAIEKSHTTATKTEELQKEVNSQNKQIQKQQAFLEKLSEKQGTIITQLDNEVKTLEKTNKEVQAQVHNLRTAKINVEQNVTQNFVQQTQKVLQGIEKAAEVDTKKIEELSTVFLEVLEQLKDAKKTIHEFQDLAKTVKETDFKIKEHAKALEQTSQEKLTLMKRVDELESMIAKFKRPKRGPMF